MVFLAFGVPTFGLAGAYGILSAARRQIQVSEELSRRSRPPTLAPSASI